VCWPTFKKANVVPTKSEKSRAELLAEIADLPPSAFVTPVQAAAYIGTTTSVLHSWRAQRRGPRYHGSNEFVRYRLADLDLWMSVRADEISLNPKPAVARAMNVPSNETPWLQGPRVEIHTLFDQRGTRRFAAVLCAANVLLNKGHFSNTPIHFVDVATGIKEADANSNSNYTCYELNTRDLRAFVDGYRPK